ncbi:hypothetical protein [Azospirillum canadense]|uniref:hypothetical protein n=1 Tax=Azospirillum canadense TaxID=403962 RepID=UPI0022274B50|nr:hypothetical protein [Azospirillum canadense]MCW2241357.1 hypothetical protein [Azospirillum canadense]
MAATRRVLLYASIGMFVTFSNGSHPAFAQSASQDWNGNRQFRSSTDRAVDISRADLQKKAQGGYYSNMSPNYYVNNYNMSTTSIGSWNQVSVGNNVSGVSLNASAQNTGCGDASIGLAQNNSPTTNSGKACGGP